MKAGAGDLQDASQVYFFSWWRHCAVANR